jgi:cellulose synthase/poly-beta-1,6-N-acetylglucosamine synthase-like glycosyltransferase
MIGTLSPLEVAIVALYCTVSLATIPFTTHACLMVALRPKKRRTADAGTPPDEWPTVTVQLPIYNERYVVDGLLEAVCAFDYPAEKLEIQVLDDSTDDTRAMLATLVQQYREQGIDIVHLHRVDRAGFKAGALREGLEVAKGEFLAIFDADFLPPPDFLRRTIPSFEDGVALVQGRWGHLNREYSLLTRANAIALDAAFVLESGVRHARHLLFQFNGTGGVWRKAALIDSGNWHDDTLTEDLDVAYRAQLGDWRLVYLNDVVCEGEIPAELDSIKTQQFRWAKGYIQNARKHLPAVLRAPHLSAFAKYEGSLLLCNHLVFPIVLLISLLVWPTARIAVEHGLGPYLVGPSILLTFLFFAYPLYFAVSQWDTYTDWRRRVALVPLLVIFMTGLSVTCSMAVASGLLNRPSPFVRTPKYRLRGKSGTWRGHRYHWPKLHPSVWVELVMATYMGVGVWYAFTHQWFAWVPFMLLPASGFALMGGLSVTQALRGRWGRAASEGHVKRGAEAAA